MFRKLILASAVYLALMSGAVRALELGGIRAESALNEPFSGQIDLLETKPDELAGVKVVLAPQAEFDKVGAPRAEFLNQLSFSAGVSAQGQSVIRVTSTEPVREPYLDFLIEVTWPSGRLIKEFTVLLDPPVTVDRPPPQVEQPAITTPKQQQATRSEPPSEPAQAVSSAGASNFPLRYGPVESGAGLWRIAKKMAKSSGASVAQTAMALYRNNQKAFIRGDINKLMVGEVLEIPTAAELAALDTAAADREFQAALRGEAVTSTPLTDITAAPRPEDRLQIAGAAEPSPDGEITPEAASEVPAESPEVASGGPAGEPMPPSGETAEDAAVPELGALKQDLLLVQETSESTRQGSEELRGRVLELEKQLADIQRLLKLSDERLAQLQSAGLPQPDVTDVGDADMSVPGDSDGSVQVAGEEQSTEIATEPKTDETAAALEPQSDVASAPGDAAQVPEAQPPAPAFWESAPRSMWALALAVPTLLLVLGWTIRRRRKSLEESLRPDDLTLDTVGGGAAADFDDAGSGAQDMSKISAAEASSLSPYSGFGGLEEETEEADVISEADVYLAYGRYREAESLLEGEIERAPDRLDVKYKLAEVYYGARNSEGMGKLMRELQQAGGDRINPDQWQRLSTLLRELAGPDAEVAPSGPPARGNEHPADMAPKPVPPVSPLSSPSAAPHSEPEPVASANGFGAEDDLFTTSPPSNDSRNRRSPEIELNTEDLEVDTGDLEIAVGEEMPEITGAASDLELQLEDLESLRDADLATMGNREPPSDSLLAESPVTTADAVSEPLDIAVTGTESLATDVLSSQWQMDSGMWDEAATKIDLARAYMEMDDPEAARVILEEVAAEGNESQQAEAKEMMAQLG